MIRLRLQETRFATTLAGFLLPPSGNSPFVVPNSLLPLLVGSPKLASSNFVMLDKVRSLQKNSPVRFALHLKTWVELSLSSDRSSPLHRDYSAPKFQMNSDRVSIPAPWFRLKRSAVESKMILVSLLKKRSPHLSVNPLVKPRLPSSTERSCMTAGWSRSRCCGQESITSSLLTST